MGCTYTTDPSMKAFPGLSFSLAGQDAEQDQSSCPWPLWLLPAAPSPFFNRVMLIYLMTILPFIQWYSPSQLYPPWTGPSASIQSPLTGIKDSFKVGSNEVKGGMTHTPL
jgi:hypothetical protein